MTCVSTDLLLQYLNPNIFEFGPERLEVLARFAKQLKCLAWSIPVITVTGTNGKGSTVTALRNIYQAAGYRAGVYTSPHLLSYHERIAVNELPISEADFLTCIKAVDEVIGKDSGLSFFERLTLIALYYFKQQYLDVLILEVGLGGRLDAVNVIDADLVIATTIALDHEDYLGHTIEAIAFEKAGLFRPHQLAIFADENCPESMLTHAQSLGTQLFHLGKDYQYQEFPKHVEIQFDTKKIVLNGKPKIRLQAMVAAIYASNLLCERLPLTAQSWQSAFDDTFLPGRVQIIEGTPKIVLDVSHNLQGVSHLVQEIKKIAGDVQVHAVFSMMKDKNCHESIQEFNKLSPIWYNTVLFGSRSHDETSVKMLFNTLAIEHQFYISPEQAFQAARSMAAKDDVIVVFGSFLIVEPVMNLLIGEGKNVLGIK